MDEQSRRWGVPTEGLVSAVIAAAVSIGAFYTLKTSVEYDEKAIESLTTRVTKIEEREREASKAWARLDERMLQVHRDLEDIDKKLEIILSAYKGEKE